MHINNSQIDGVWNLEVEMIWLGLNGQVCGVLGSVSFLIFIELIWSWSDLRYHCKYSRDQTFIFTHSQSTAVTQKSRTSDGINTKHMSTRALSESMKCVCVCVNAKLYRHFLWHCNRIIIIIIIITEAFMNPRRQMSESEEKEMIVNPFRTSGFSFQQENECFIPVVLWHILFQRLFSGFHLNLRCFCSLWYMTSENAQVW